MKRIIALINFGQRLYFLFPNSLYRYKGDWPTSQNEKIEKRESSMELKDMKVFIDAGHGGTDSGATSLDKTTLEKDINLYVAKKLQSILTSRSVVTNMTRTSDIYVPYTQIASISNSWGADIFVSIHCNAGGGAGGTETYTQVSYSAYDDDLAKRIQSSLVTAFASIDRGVKRTDWSVLVGNNAYCCLTELLFMDVAADIAKLRDPVKLDSAAMAIANALDSFVFVNFHNIPA